MGHKKDDCKSCKGGSRRRHGRSDRGCGKKEEKSQVERRYPPGCGECAKPICDCRSPCQDDESLDVRTGLLVAPVDPSPGIIAEAQINLNDDPVYRNPTFDVCRRRRVVVTANVTVTGGTAANAIQLIGGVFFDNASPDDYFIFDESDPVIIPAGATRTLTLRVEGDLDNNRILYVALRYLTEETPAPGTGVTYVPPTGTNPTNVTVTIYPSRRYPTIQDEPRRIIILPSSSQM